MAITTLDGAIAGTQPSRFIAKAATGTLTVGRWHSLWANAGLPGAGGFDATLNGVALSSSSANVAGQIPFSDPVSGSAYLAAMQVNCSQAAQVLLVDRLWHNGNITNNTSSQAITFSSLPARDNAGTVNGEGVLLAIEVESATSATAATITVTYTNSDGTAGRTGTFITGSAPDGTNAGIAGAWYPISLQSGDKGVRSVQSLQFGTAFASGTVHLVAYRVIASAGVASANVPQGIDVVTGGLPKMFNGSVPQIVLAPSAASAVTFNGTVTYTTG